MFQFALPRGERLGLLFEVDAHIHVSIRAPAWGATHLGAVGINAHARFNSRSRVGSDAGEVLVLTDKGYVSIRAPAWGATPFRVIA